MLWLCATRLCSACAWWRVRQMRWLCKEWPVLDWSTLWTLPTLDRWVCVNSYHSWTDKEESFAYRNLNTSKSDLRKIQHTLFYWVVIARKFSKNKPSDRVTVRKDVCKLTVTCINLTLEHLNNSLSHVEYIFIENKGCLTMLDNNSKSLLHCIIKLHPFFPSLLDHWLELIPNVQISLPWPTHKLCDRRKSVSTEACPNSYFIQSTRALKWTFCTLVCLRVQTSMLLESCKL